MNPIPSHRPTSGAPPPPPRRGLNWGTFGLAEAWVHSRIDPLAERHNQYLYRAVDCDTLAQVVAEESDWDILFVGATPDAVREAGSLETIVDRISRARPLDCVIVVTPEPVGPRHLLLMRMGAIEVLTPDDPAERIEQALERAIAVAQTRRTHVDQDKLRLLSQLAISVNHEVNNPLTGIMGTAELMLLDNKELDEKSQRDLQVIIQQCHRIQEVTARLKNLNHLRTVPYGMHDQMLDLIGEMPAVLPTSAPAATDEQFLPTPRVLVVDDNPLIIDLIARLFEQRFHIEAASCASDALSRVERAEFDLVLIDLILPEMNGLELFRAIRRLRPRQKALLTTAHTGDARVEQAIAEGALGCVYKPFQLDDLEQVLTDALKPRRRPA